MGELVDDRLHFANSEFLLSKLGLVPGSVSLFGLLNNKDKDVNVFIDEDIINFYHKTIFNGFGIFSITMRHWNKLSLICSGTQSVLLPNRRKPA